MKIPTLFFVVLFLHSLVFAFDLPLPDQTTRVAGDQINYNSTPYNTEIYRSQLPEAEVAAFYKNTLPQEGFTLITEEKVPHSLHFANLNSKEHIFMLLDNSATDEIQINVSSWKGDLNVSYESPEEMSSDAVGSEDVPGVPRYPGSIRISATNNGQMQNACYRTADSREEIYKFYENRMSAQGWNVLPESGLVKQKIAGLVKEGNSAQSAQYLLYNKDSRLLVIVISGECCGSKKNIISVLLTREQVLRE